MGWRTQEAYEAEAHEQWRALPWRERYYWRGLIAFALIIAICGAYVWAKLHQ